MAEILSNRELLEGMTGGNTKLQSDLLNQPSDLDTLTNVLKRGATGLYSNIDNLTGNLADLIGGKPRVNILDRFSQIQNNNNLNEFEKAIQSGKSYFDTPSTKGGISQLLNLASPKINEALLSGREEAELKHQEYNAKQQAVGQYANGSMGDMIGEMFLATPIMKYGNMAKTTASLQAGDNALKTAKAISMDSIGNASTLGATELLLGKAYGKSDEEAMTNAVMAGAMGLAGTPLLGGAMKGLNILNKAEIKLQNEMAGGGVPTKQQQAELDKYADIAFDEPASPVKQEVKPTKETVKTKGGRTVDAEEVLQSKKIIEDIEYNVSEPRADVGLPIEGQTYVPEVNNPKKFKYGYDERGRVYTEEASSLSPQGGATQKATLEQRVKPVIDDALEEVNRRLEFYDNDSALRNKYGQTQAVYKKTNELSEAQSKANRLQFEKQQYKDIIKSEVGEIKKQAREKLDELNKIKIEDYKPSPKQIVKAQELFDKQTKVPDTNLKLREIDLKDEYKAYKESMEKSSKEGYEFDKPTKSQEDIKKKVISDAKIKLPKAKEAIREVTKKEKLAGRSFDPTDINDIQRKKYRDEIAIIEDIQGARADVKLLNEGKIDLKEFIYRAKRRLDEEIARGGKSQFKTKSEAEQHKNRIIEQYNDIGVFVKADDIKMKDEPTGKKEPESIRIAREKRELEESKSKNTSTLASIQKYIDTGDNPRLKSGPRKGQFALTKSQVEDIDRGILTPEEIVNKTSPIGLKKDISELKTKAKEKANLKTTQETRKQLGIKDNFLSPLIQFKDTLLDSSNSVAQITTVLLSSKRLAKLSKLHGGKDDIREIVANKMEDLLPKDFVIKPTKKTVKPIFMTENYGQGKKGLIRNIQKANNVSKEEATQFFDAYEKAFGSIAPEMKELRDVVQLTMKNNPNGEFSWTLPDGFKVEFNLKKKLDGTYSIKGNENAFKIQSNNLDDFSRALMPNMIHSVDAYVARKMNKKGIATVHDAFQTPASKTDKYVQEEYGKIMSEINESNLLDSILKDLGYKGPSLKKGDLPSGKIKESATKSAIEPEEVKGATKKSKVKEIDISKSNTPDEIMKEYMASGNVRESGFNQLVADMTNEAGYRTMSVAREGDDVFTHQVAMAHQSEKYNPSKAIKAPDGVDVDSWNRVQKQIFNEARARLEYNPLTTEKIKGNHKFFAKDGNMIGDNQKTFNEILEEVKRADLETNTKIENITKENSKVFEKKAEPEVKETIKKSEKVKVELGVSSNGPNKTTNIIYHGSPNKIKEFKSGRTDMSIDGVDGIYFSTNKDMASQFAGDKGFLHEVELNTDKIYDVKNPPKTFTKDEMLSLGFTEKELNMVSPKDGNYFVHDLFPITIFKTRSRTYKQNSELMKKLGYDAMTSFEDSNLIVMNDKIIKVKSINQNKADMENAKVKEEKLDNTLRSVDKPNVELKTKGGIFNETIENWKAGYKSEGVYGQINKLHSLTRNALNQSAKVGQVTKNTISDIYKANGLKDKNPFDTNFQKSILDTDYISHKMSEKESKLFAREHNDLYQSLKSKIDQSAKGLKNKGDMNHPDYYPNAILLARSNGIPIEKADIIDKLISIKAMDDLDWKFIRENKDSQMFKELSSMTETARVQTKELFKDDITKAMKGYRLETYDSLYKMKEGKLVPDVGDGMEQGALPNNLLGKKVGDRTPQPKDTKQTSAEYREQALEEGLGLVFDRSGNPMGLRKVASEVERDSMGRQVSAMETLSATLESNTRKLMQSDGVIVEARRMLDEGNDLFSRTPFKDSIKLTLDEIKTLPKEIQDILYVNKDFKQMLLGNKEIQIFKDGMLSVIEQIYKDGFVHFKQNVVLKNPASWVNNYMFGMVMNVNAGMSPKKAFQYSKQGPAIYAEMQKLTEDLIELELKGKLDSARGRTVKTKLESNEIYQMVQEGMAVSVMADLIKTSGKSHLFTDKAIGKGLRSIIGDKATDALSNIYIHSSSKTGRVANSMFTRIDVMHRYALAKHMLDEGANMKEAVSKSNGVYGDLDLISPVWSQAIQHYGFVPFSNWFFRISGGLQDTTRKNIARTIALSAGFYGLSEMTDKRTESWNPLLTLVNTPFDFVEMSPFHRPMNTIKNTMMPKVYGKVGNAISNEDPLSIAITENFK